MTDENNNPQGDPENLGDAGKAALVAERKRADEAERALRAANVKVQQLEESANTELAAAQARVAELEGKVTELSESVAAKDLTITRLNVGIDEGLPKNLIERLQGADEEAIKSDASTLRTLIPVTTPDPFPKADPSQGPKGAGKASNADVFAEFVSNKL